MKGRKVRPLGLDFSGEKASKQLWFSFNSTRNKSFGDAECRHESAMFD